MIRAAELRGVTTEYEKYVAAVNLFKEKYLGLPGDLKNATAFWGAAHATPATCVTTVGTDMQTCNGDGDGYIEFATAANRRGENYMFWQHLANAGLIEGKFSGFTGAGGFNHAIINSNVPESRIGGVGWTQMWFISSLSVPQFFDGTYGNFLSVGREFPAWETVRSAFTPLEAKNVDSKIDDGMPATGSMIVRRSIDVDTCAINSGGVVPASSDMAAVYNLSLQTAACGLIFRELY